MNQTDSQFRTKRMENATYWAAQMAGWMKNGPNTVDRDVYYVEIIGGRPVLVFSEWWNEYNVNVIRDSLREYDFPPQMKINDMEGRHGEAFRLFIMEPSDDRLMSYYDDDWRNFESQHDFADER